MNRYPLPRWLLIAGGALLAALGLGLANLALVEKTVTVRAGDQTLTLRTQAATVGEALLSANFALYPEDLVQPPLDSPLAADATITLTRAQPVQIIEGDLSVLIRTRQSNLTAILAEAGLTAAPTDSVWADGQRIPPEQWAAPRPAPRTLQLQRAVSITLVDQNNAQTLTTAALTVGEALAAANIPLFVADGVTPALDSPLTPDLVITLQRSQPITLEADGRALPTRTHRATVAEVLTDLGLALLGLDYTIPPLDAPPPTNGAPIRLVRVIEQIITETQPLAYDTQYRPLPEVEIDNTQIVQAGAYGAAATRVRVRYENGIEVSRAAEESWTATAPQPRIIGYGTKIVLRTVETADGVIEYWRAVRMYAASYSASRSGTSPSAPWYGRTRSGKKLTIGMVAIDLNVMPLGTRLYVPGYGYATAEDTGGGVKGKIIDLGYDDWNYVGWHQYVIVYFLTPVPPAEQIKWVIP